MTKYSSESLVGALHGPGISLATLGWSRGFSFFFSSLMRAGGAMV